MKIMLLTFQSVNKGRNRLQHVDVHIRKTILSPSLKLDRHYELDSILTSKSSKFSDYLPF
jgi:hypothetical protein